MPADLLDSFSRTISYLRISLTDQCNLRCLYCRPLAGEEKLARLDLLSYEEILRVVRVAVGLGIIKVRLTGGEPLVRSGVLPFIGELSVLPGLDEIRLTTNGVLLDRAAAELYQAGIRKLNISLDSLKRWRFAEITGGDFFDRVWAGIEEARRIGFSPIKLNVVVMRGVNDDEIIDFARLVQDQPFHVRFIEFMPIGNSNVWQESRYLPASEIRARIESVFGVLSPVSSHKLDGPARLFTLSSAQGSIGFISPLSDHFCDTCNRLRLTSAGKLRSCLLTDRETDIKSVLRSGCSDREIEELIVATIREKPKGHTLAEAGIIGSCHGQMSRIGG